MFRINVPTNVDALLSCMKQMGISNDDVEKFQDEIYDAEYSIAFMNEDVRDKKQSLLFAFFKHELGSKSIFYDVKAIMNGTTIDYLLGKYYETCGINDYYDKNNNGKFSLFLNNHGLDSDAVIAELENKVDLKDQKLVKFGIEHDYYPHEMYEAVQFCYKYKRMPITMHNFHLLSSNEYIVKWEHINNVIK
eukprot:457996_1